MPSPETGLVLDLTTGGSLPPGLLRRLDSLAEAHREEFNAMIGMLSKGHERDIDWWVSLPARRNTHVGALFGKCIQLALVRSLLNEGVKFSVRTDDAALARVLKQELGSPQLICVTGLGAWRARLRDAASSIFHVFSARRAARRTRHLGRPVPQNAGIMEIYVERDSFDANGFRDRYYPGFYENLSATQRARHFYLPTFYRIRDYATLLRQLRSAPQNFLLREDYLTWHDYAFAFGHWWRAGRLKGMQAHFAGFSVGPLLDAELQNGRFSNSTMQALLSYRFWRYCAMLPEATLLDWYEGHDSDHAIAAAIRWHGSGTRLVAHRGIAPFSYISTVPALHEIEQQVVAPEWAVVGHDMKDWFTARFPMLSIMSAPGLRHRPLLNGSVKGRHAGLPSVLVLLSLELPLVQLVADMIAAASRIGDCHWLVKRHPGLHRERAEASFREVVNATLIEGNFADALAQADIVIGLGTNTLIEAAAMGVPVICVSGGNMPTELPFASGEAVWWRAAYDADELVAAIHEAMEVPMRPRNEMMERLLGPFDPGILRDILLP